MATLLGINPDLRVGPFPCVDRSSEQFTPTCQSLISGEHQLQPQRVVPDLARDVSVALLDQSVLVADDLHEPTVAEPRGSVNLDHTSSDLGIEVVNAKTAPTEVKAVKVIRVGEGDPDDWVVPAQLDRQGITRTETESHWRVRGLPLRCRYSGTRSLRGRPHRE